MAKTVMIVDDAVSIRGLASMTLENAGYQVIEAQTSGAKAWIVKPFKPNTILSVVQKVIG